MTNIGYSSSGKVILINPAGIMFGAGSSVNLNSFTASTMDFKGAKNLIGVNNAPYAQLNKFNNSKVEFVKNSKNGNITLNNTKINTNKTFQILSDDLISISGSEIKTKPTGQIRIITSDGASFAYELDGTLANNFQLKTSSKQTDISLTNTKTEGGTFYLSNNSKGNVELNGVKISSSGNFSTGIYSNGKTGVYNSNISSNHVVISGGNTFVNNTKVDAKDFAGVYASAVNGTNNINYNSEIKAKNINLSGSHVYTTNSSIKKIK